MFGLFRRARQGEAAADRIVRRDWSGYIYAIGDVHGCYGLLRELEALIAIDCAQHRAAALVIYLGDYVDRGDNSAAVLDHLSARSASGPERFCLAGNHEEMMLDFIVAPQPDHGWLRNGGDATLRSYGLDAATLFAGGKRAAAQRLISHIPQEHLDFLRSLPACLSLPGLVFVHAGLVPDIPLDQQRVNDMLWMRPTSQTYQAPQPFGIVVHGHTPSAKPILEPQRICVDTGAFATGILTCVRIAPDNGATFMSVPHETRLSL